MLDTLTIPKAMNRLPRDQASNAPIPWCAEYEKGVAVPGKFSEGRIARAFGNDICPWCGGETGRRDSYLFIGEESIVNRICYLPAGHIGCTTFMLRLAFPGLVCMERHGVVSLHAAEEDPTRIRFALAREMPLACTWWVDGEPGKLDDLRQRLELYQSTRIAEAAESLEERSGAEMLMVWATDRLEACYAIDVIDTPPAQPETL